MGRTCHDVDSGWHLLGVAAVERTIGPLDPEVVDGDYPALRNAVAVQPLQATVNAHNPCSSTVPPTLELCADRGPLERQRQRDAITVRVIEYRLEGVADAEPRYRSIAALLDPAKAPAEEFAFGKEGEKAAVLEDGPRLACLILILQCQKILCGGVGLSPHIFVPVADAGDPTPRERSYLPEIKYALVVFGVLKKRGGTDPGGADQRSDVRGRAWRENNH